MNRSTHVWLLVSAAAALLFSFVAASAVSAQASDDDPALVEVGQAVFELNCAGCHQSDGSGSSQGRRLIGVASEQPDRSAHIMSVTNGKGAMPAFGSFLSAEEIEAAVTYVRLTFVDPAVEAEASDEEAADADPEALADTGTETAPLAVIGFVLLGTGALLVHHGGRLRRG